MKKIIVLLFIILFLVTAQTSYAQETSIIPMASASAVTPTPEPIPYQLPYPGLLPDNPLYFLKTFRDRAVSFLISDPLKKAEFNLLQANKRLQGGAYLMDKKPFDMSLVITTISKGQNYFEEAVVSVSDARKQGISILSMLDQLSISSRKHKEVLLVLQKKVPQKNRAEFDVLIKRADKIEKSVNALILKNKKK